MIVTKELVKKFTKSANNADKKGQLVCTIKDGDGNECKDTLAVILNFLYKIFCYIYRLPCFSELQALSSRETHDTKASTTSCCFEEVAKRPRNYSICATLKQHKWVHVFINSQSVVIMRMFYVHFIIDFIFPATSFWRIILKTRGKFCQQTQFNRFYA